MNEPNLRPQDETRKHPTLADLIGDAIATALTRPDVIQAARQIFGAVTVPPIAEPVDGLLSKAQLARALGVSGSTVDRLDIPHVVVGARRRYDLGACREFLARRGKRTTAKPASGARVDVGSVLSGAGLRVVGGGK